MKILRPARCLVGKSSAVPDAFSELDLGDQPTRFDLVLRRALNELSHPPRHKGPFRKKDFPVVNTGNFVVRQIPA